MPLFVGVSGGGDESLILVTVCSDISNNHLLQSLSPYHPNIRFTIEENPNRQTGLRSRLSKRN